MQLFPTPLSQLSHRIKERRQGKRTNRKNILQYEIICSFTLEDDGRNAK